MSNVHLVISIGDILRANHDPEWVKTVRGSLLERLDQVHSITYDVCDLGGLPLSEVAKVALEYRKAVNKVTRMFDIFALPNLYFLSDDFTPEMVTDDPPWERPEMCVWSRVFLQEDVNYEYDGPLSEEMLDTMSTGLRLFGPALGILLFACAQCATDESSIEWSEEDGEWSYDADALDAFLNLWQFSELPSLESV